MRASLLGCVQSPDRTGSIGPNFSLTVRLILAKTASVFSQLNSLAILANLWVTIVVLFLFRVINLAAGC